MSSPFKLPPSSYSAQSPSNSRINDVYSALGLSSSPNPISSPEKEDTYTPSFNQIEILKKQTDDPWSLIRPESYEWHQILRAHSSAFVVRLKTMVKTEEPKDIINKIFSICQVKQKQFKLENSSKNTKITQKDMKILKNELTKMVDIVCKFDELSVSESSPIVYETRILFVYYSASDYNPVIFDEMISTLLPKDNIPYTTIEMLESFLTRRDFDNVAIEGENALSVLETHINRGLPCSSLFLKLSAAFCEECLALLKKLVETQRDPRTLLGERALHKLAVTYSNKQNKGHGSLRASMDILKIGLEPTEWGYVAFNTLMRLAEEEDKATMRKLRIRGSRLDRVKALRKSSVPMTKGAITWQVDLLDALINVSQLDPIDKIALKLMSGAADIENAGRIDFSHPEYESVVAPMMKLLRVCDGKSYSSDEDLNYCIEIFQSGSTPACHLLSIAIRRCVDKQQYNNGWRIASTVPSISKQVFGEVVTLCCKAYFAQLRGGRPEANVTPSDVWFDRISYCVENYLEFLNRYPCGLTLHVAAHRKDFKTCWDWFSEMRERLAFRLTGYHTSAVIKAASFEVNPPVDKIKEAYLMTPTQEKSTFTFVPLIRVWDNCNASLRATEISFWEDVVKDVKSCLENHNASASSSDTQLNKVVTKLLQWIESFENWKSVTKKGTDIPPYMTRRASARPTVTEPALSGRSKSDSRSKSIQAGIDLKDSFLTRRFSDIAGGEVEILSSLSPTVTAGPHAETRRASSSASFTTTGLGSGTSWGNRRRWSENQESTTKGPFSLSAFAPSYANFASSPSSGVSFSRLTSSYKQGSSGRSSSTSPPISPSASYSNFSRYQLGDSRSPSAEVGFALPSDSLLQMDSGSRRTSTPKKTLPIGKKSSPSN